jgi:hypothetical protein
MSATGLVRGNKQTLSLPLHHEIGGAPDVMVVDYPPTLSPQGAPGQESGPPMRPGGMEARTSRAMPIPGSISTVGAYKPDFASEYFPNLSSRV